MDRTCEILVVDDEPIVGGRLKATLERDGHKVSVFVDPVEAMKALDSKVYDIVITDIRMGEVDGVELLEAVRTRTAHTRVIMITGYATLELARESLAKGAFDFIAKPFKLGEIRKTLHNAIASLPPTPAGGPSGAAGGGA
jgi:DNA-binding NtrC family response regulator